MSTASEDSASTHPYVPPSPGESRSPCPGLNALANHGYLPHDGRNLSLTQLVAAVHGVYALSRPLAGLLAFVALVVCGRWQGARRVLDLHGLARHGVLEHDASLVHDDTPAGEAYAPTAVDRTLLRQLLDGGRGHGGAEEPVEPEGLSLRELCGAQVGRQRASRPLKSWKDFALSRGEIGLAYTVFGMPVRPGSGAGGATAAEDDRVVPRAVLEQWLGEERLPEGWRGPTGQATLFGLHSLVGVIGRLEDRLKETSAPEASPSPSLDSKDVVG